MPRLPATLLHVGCLNRSFYHVECATQLDICPSMFGRYWCNGRHAKAEEVSAILDPPGPSLVLHGNARFRRNLATGAGIDEGPQCTRKLSCPEIQNFSPDRTSHRT